MKNAIRLLVLAGALLSVGALAQAGNATNFNFNFPAYAFVFTNVDTVTFDFDQTSGTSQLESVTGYYEASSAGLAACLDAFLESDTNNTLDGTGSYTIQTPSTTSNTCNFAPTSVTKNSSAFTVDWGSTGNPDGELLVITNAGGYTVTATFADGDGDWPSGLNIDIIAGVVSGATIAGAGQNVTSVSLGSTSTSATFNQNDDYTTQFANAYVIPQLYALQLDVMSASINTQGTVDASVTYTVTAP